MPQYGFFFDQSRCSGCRSCTVACKNWHELPPGPLKYLRIYEYEKGVFPDIRIHFQWLPCYHCEEPACVDICPFDAIHKEEKYGAVVIDKDKCVGCRLCYDACPYGALVFENDKACQAPAADRTQAPCAEACPVHVNVPRYVGYLGEGKIAEAVAVLREKLPFPSVCGRVCFSPCEAECSRNKIDDPVAIRALKRHATDQDTGSWKEKIKVAPANGKRVAVVGSGPAGLTASHYLARSGYGVTVFEAMPEPGGMMRYGIPDFRLPKDLVEDEINYIKELGVDIKTNTSIGDGQSLLDLKDGQGYAAVFIATGASISQQLDVEGIGLDGVRLATDLMKKVNQGEKVSFEGQKVVVMGGGNVAVDTAMTVLRLGAREVRMVCLESRDEMPAHDLEISRLLAEGVVLQNSLGLKQINGKDGKVTGLELMSCRSVYDNKGNFCPCYDETVTTPVEADAIILAIGQKVDTSLLNGSGIMVSDGRIVSDENTLGTNIPGVFAGGDAVTGPNSVIEAIAAGRKAAAAIDKYLGGSGNFDDELSKPVKREMPPTKADVNRSRVSIGELEPEARINSFNEIELPLDDQAAVNEARRCVECDPVTARKCDMCIDRLEIGEQPMCVSTCPNRALDFGPLSELIEKYGDNRDIEDMPDSQDTKPAVIFKAHRPKRQLVPYDSEKAIKLFMRRDPLPPVFSSLEDVIEIPEGTVGRNELVIKHDSADDLMKHTRNDES